MSKEMTRPPVPACAAVRVTGCTRVVWRTGAAAARNPAQRWPAAAGPRFDRGECPAMDSDENRAWAAIFAGAEADRFTGTIYGPPTPDAEGVRWQAVHYYEAGVCTDRFLTKAGVQL